MTPRSHRSKYFQSLLSIYVNVSWQCSLNVFVLILFMWLKNAVNYFLKAKPKKQLYSTIGFFPAILNTFKNSVSLQNTLCIHFPHISFECQHRFECQCVLVYKEFSLNKLTYPRTFEGVFVSEVSADFKPRCCFIFDKGNEMGSFKYCFSQLWTKKTLFWGNVVCSLEASKSIKCAYN